MNASRWTVPITAVLLALAASAAPAGDPDYIFPEPATEWAPKRYVCHRSRGPIAIDGVIDGDWDDAAWTDDFVDIEGDLKPRPRFRTRVAMLWDETYFYVAADMEEPDVWATLKKRDSVIFYDNDFEVFIDPDGDTHEYYELEVNAFGTEWDLLLTKPYRDAGTAIDSWDIQGLVTGIAVDGTLNRPGDVDAGWSVELAIPWAVLEECAHGPAPPDVGDQWRVNFSRVEWQTEVKDGDYVKLTDPDTGKSLPEDNWVWSPQGLINMHYPERWGFVQFAGRAGGSSAGENDPDEFAPDWLAPAEQALRVLYYKERTYFGRHGLYADFPSELGLGDAPRTPTSWPPVIETTTSMFEARVFARDGTSVHISHDGRVWRTQEPRPGGEERDR